MTNAYTRNIRIPRGAAHSELCYTATAGSEGRFHFVIPRGPCLVG